MFTQRKLPDYARPGTRRRQLHCLACPVGAGLVEVYGDRPGRTAEWVLVGSRDYEPPPWGVWRRARDARMMR